jgi:glycosyltransferase involved in cell wall biosynthesis
VRLAIVHDWLVTYAGAERVLEQMLAVYPDADLYTMVDSLADEERFFIGGRKPRTSFIQHLPGARRRYRSYLPLMPLAVEQFDLSAYDLVISSSYAVAKGVLTGPDQLHLCLCYSPIRYAWDLQHQYLRESGLERGIRSWLARYLLHRIRTWDALTANRVDGFIAISDFIARRIRKVYRREAEVIYPPVDTDAFDIGREKEDYFVTASRMVPYKRMDLVVEAFSQMPDRRLVVIGDGPEAAKVRSKAGSNVQLLGQQPLSVLRENLQRARGFVFAAEEDFGIAPLEAQACGTPVIAFGKGGVCETIRDLEDSNPTGVFFGEQTVAAIVEAVHRFDRESQRISPAACRANALRFSIARFRREFHGYVEDQVSRFRAGIKGRPSGDARTRDGG